MPPAVVAAVAAAATGAIISKAMSKSPREPAALPEPAAIEEPKLEPVKAVMPTIDTKSVEEARRRSLLRQTQRQGRESTILTEGKGPSDSLGGGY